MESKLVNKIINWLRLQLEESQSKGIILGLSGGVDSSLVAVLAKKAVGKKMLALILPCGGSHQDIKDAQLIAKKFEIKTKLIDLRNIYDNFIKVLPGGNRIAEANLKARLRMATLYYFANKLNYLVAGTGNKSELSIGYFTKYGDGGADILPIGGLLKTDVRNLARELGVPEKIINKPPSAGLWSGQTDEGEMGITYAELDDILNRLEKNKRHILPDSKVQMIKDKMEKSRHKRKMPKIFSPF